MTSKTIPPSHRSMAGAARPDGLKWNAYAIKQTREWTKPPIRTKHQQQQQQQKLVVCYDPILIGMISYYMAFSQ